MLLQVALNSSQAASMADNILGDCPFMAENSHKVRINDNPHDLFQFSHGPLLDLFITQIDRARVGCAAHHRTQQNMAFRSPLRKNT